MTIKKHADSWLVVVERGRSVKTFETYRNAFNQFAVILKGRKINIHKHDATSLSEVALSWFIASMVGLSPATERVYTTAIKNFYRYLNSDGLTSFNMDRVDHIIKSRTRKIPLRSPAFDEEGINSMLSKLEKMPYSKNKSVMLREMRDRALILTLADTGLRIHEALKLRVGDVGSRTKIIGKGDKEATIRFSKRSLSAIAEYLKERNKKTYFSHAGKDAPLFARHDKGAGSKVLAISPDAGRDIVDLRVSQLVETGRDDRKKKITPHQFRHFFVTSVLKKSGSLKLAQELARHSNIQITQRYAHLNEDETDETYRNIFD